MSQWYLRTQDETFGPEDESRLVEWAKMGRIQPGQEISEDNEIWSRVEDVPFLDMRFSIDLGDGNPRGPFNKAAAEALLASGRLPPTATLVETRAPFDASPTGEKVETPPVPQPEPVEKIVEKIVEVPVEKIVEKIVEVPVEKIVEKIVEKEVRVEVPIEKEVIKEVEKIVEVPVEKEVIKEVEKIVVDETRVKELEAQLKESQECGEELSARVSSLEEELKRLPQSAAEIADAQAAAYSIMTSEAEELAKILELEKRESEEFRRRSQERMDRLSERRCDLLRRAGASVEDMTRKALGERPEDPRTTMLRKELEDLRRLGEKKAFDDAREIMSLKEQLRDSRALAARRAEQDKDAAQLRAEIEDLRLKLQIREKDLVAERQKCETLRQQQALNQQALMARLASLESPSIGTTSSIETNQSREAKLVKLPGWMRLKK